MFHPDLRVFFKKELILIPNFRFFNWKFTQSKNLFFDIVLKNFFNDSMNSFYKRISLLLKSLNVDSETKDYFAFYVVRFTSFLVKLNNI